MHNYYMLDFKMANAKLSVKINRALLLLTEQQQQNSRRWYSLLKNHVSAKIFIEEKGLEVINLDFKVL